MACAVLYDLILQAKRSTNPYLDAGTIIINVVMPPGDFFSFEAMLNGKYKLELLAGQHVCSADNLIMQNKTIYVTSDDVPKSIKFKSAVILVQITDSEKSMVVGNNNDIDYRTSSFMDRVRCKFVIRNFRIISRLFVGCCRVSPYCICCFVTRFHHIVYVHFFIFLFC